MNKIEILTDVFILSKTRSQFHWDHSLSSSMYECIHIAIKSIFVSNFFNLKSSEYSFQAVLLSGMLCRKNSVLLKFAFHVERQLWCLNGTFRLNFFVLYLAFAYANHNANMKSSKRLSRSFHTTTNTQFFLSLPLHVFFFIVIVWQSFDLLTTAEATAAKTNLVHIKMNLKRVSFPRRIYAILTHTHTNEI